VTRAEAVRRTIDACLAGLTATMPDGVVEVSTSTSRGPKIAAIGGEARLYLTVEIVIDGPDEVTP
jgi:hypothetical protein